MSKLKQIAILPPIEMAEIAMKLMSNCEIWQEPNLWRCPLFCVNGNAEICSRALNGVPFQAGIVRHDQIWYDDGTNSGFFDTDDVRPDYMNPNDLSKGKRPKRDYNSCRYIGSDSDVRAAEIRVQENMDTDWRLSDNNCQMYAEAVAQEASLVETRIEPVGVVNTGEE